MDFKAIEKCICFYPHSLNSDSFDRLSKITNPELHSLSSFQTPHEMRQTNEEFFLMAELLFTTPTIDSTQ